MVPGATPLARVTWFFTLTTRALLARPNFARAVLRALGAPARFVFAVVWGYAAILIGIGSAIGVTIGFAATRIISAIVTARTDIDVHASLDWPEFHLVAGFVSLTLLLALLPAFAALRRPVIADLRT